MGAVWDPSIRSAGRQKSVQEGREGGRRGRERYTGWDCAVVVLLD